jgi:hypothetical protein
MLKWVHTQIRDKQTATEALLVTGTLQSCNDDVVQLYVRFRFDNENAKSCGMKGPATN